jgi:hypothetical protein
LSDLFFFGGLGNGFFMAFKAGGQGRDSGKGLGFEEPVTGIAVEALFGMLLMVEGDRLTSSGAKTKTDDEEEQKKPGRQSKEEKFHAVNPLVNTSPPEESPDSCKIHKG